MILGISISGPNRRRVLGRRRRRRDGLAHPPSSAPGKTLSSPCLLAAIRLSRAGPDRVDTRGATNEPQVLADYGHKVELVQSPRISNPDVAHPVQTRHQ